MNGIFRTKKATATQPPIVVATPEFIQERANRILEETAKELRLLAATANEAQCYLLTENLHSYANSASSWMSYLITITKNERYKLGHD